MPRDFRIVYEDESIIAVDKPAGLPVVPDGGFLENTLVHLLSRRYPGENPVPAHRLNRGTSGLILFSRTSYSNFTMMMKTMKILMTESRGSGSFLSCACFF